MRTLILVLLLLGGRPAAAQVQTQSPLQAPDKRTTVRIENGAVFLDDRRLGESEYPATLRAENQHAQFRFFGEARFYIDGLPYSVKDGRIVEAVPLAGESIVVRFRTDELADMAAEAPAAGTIRFSGPPSGTIGSFAKALDARAARLEALGEELAARSDEERTITVQNLHRETEEAAFVMRAFPRIEMKSYLDLLQVENSALYGRLLRELEMENQSGMLAGRILVESDARLRADLERSLRTSLEEVFELKQQNRRDEITQLEKQLGDLRRQLQARELNRRAIIDRRLEELVGQTRR